MVYRVAIDFPGDPDGLFSWTPDRIRKAEEVVRDWSVNQLWSIRRYGWGRETVKELAKVRVKAHKHVVGRNPIQHYLRVTVDVPWEIDSDVEQMLDMLCTNIFPQVLGDPHQNRVNPRYKYHDHESSSDYSCDYCIEWSRETIDYTGERCIGCKRLAKDEIYTLPSKTTLVV